MGTPLITISCLHVHLFSSLITCAPLILHLLFLIPNHSLLIPHSSPCNPHSSLLTRSPHPSLLTPHSSSLIPHFSPSHLNPYPSLFTPHYLPLTPHFSLLTPHPSLLIPHHTPLTPHPSLLTPHPSCNPHLSSYTPHPSPLTPHPSSYTPHPSLLTPHPSLLIPYHTPLTPHSSLLTPHPSLLIPHHTPLTPYLISLCNRFCSDHTGSFFFVRGRRYVIWLTSLHCRRVAKGCCFILCPRIGLLCRLTISGVPRLLIVIRAPGLVVGILLRYFCDLWVISHYKCPDLVSFPAPLLAAILFSPGRWVWYLSAESLDVNLRIRGNQSDCGVANTLRKSHVVKMAKWRLLSLYYYYYCLI